VLQKLRGGVNSKVGRGAIDDIDRTDWPDKKHNNACLLHKSYIIPINRYNKQEEWQKEDIMGRC
jgi:hypothetical protein